jgi:hypothetical protein
VLIFSREYVFFHVKLDSSHVILETLSQEPCKFAVKSGCVGQVSKEFNFLDTSAWMVKKNLEKWTLQVTRREMNLFSFLFFFCGNCVETFTSTLSRSDLRLGDGVGFRVIRIDLKFFKRLYLKF